MVCTAQAVDHGDLPRARGGWSVAPQVAESFEFGDATRNQAVPILEGASVRAPHLRYDHTYLLFGTLFPIISRYPTPASWVGNLLTALGTIMFGTSMSMFHVASVV